MTTKPDMTLEEYIKLTSDLTEGQYGAEPPEPFDPIFREAETRKERMIAKKLLSGYTDLTKSEMEKIEDEVRTSANIKVGKFVVTLGIYRNPVASLVNKFSMACVPDQYCTYSVHLEQIPEFYGEKFLHIFLAHILFMYDIIDLIFG